MKKLITIMMVVMFSIGFIPQNVYAEDEFKLKVNSYGITKGKITKGDEVNFSIEVYNSSSNQITDVMVTINSKAFKPLDGERVYSIEKLSAGDVKEFASKKLIYDGSEASNLEVVLSYKDSTGSHSQTYHIPVDVIAGDNIDPDKLKTENYKPKLRVENKDILSVNEGENINIQATLKNISKYTAENLEVIPVVDGSNFELTEMAPYASKNSLEENAKWTVNFKMKAKEVDSTGTYPVKLKLTFNNKFNDSWTEEINLYIKINQTDEDDEYVTVNNKFEDRAYNSEEVFEIPLNIQNKGEKNISDVRVIVQNIDRAKIDNFNTSVDLGSIEGKKEKEAKIKFKVKEDTVSGNYPIEFKVTYINAKGKKKELTETVFVNVNKLSEEIVFGQFKYDSVIDEEEIFTVSVPVKNDGNKVAEKVKVVLNGVNGIINRSNNTVIINELQPGEEKVIEFEMQAVKGNKDKQVSLNAILNNDIQQQLTVYIEGEEAESTKSVPKVIISKYQVEPMIVKAGHKFDLNVTFLNTHSEKTVKNIKVTLTTNEGSEKTGSVFTPVNSSNTFYIDRIPPKGEANMAMTMYTIPDAKSKTYIVNVNMEYEDESGPITPVNDMIGIPVRQDSKFMTSDIIIPEQVAAGEPIRLDIDISNTGKVDLSNFTVKVEGDFRASNSNTYVGNISLGGREYYSVTLFADTPGEAKGEFVFVYEEPSGEVIEVRKEIKSTVVEMNKPLGNNNNNMGNPYEEIPMEPEKKFPWVKVGIGAVVVLGVVVVIVVKRKKAKKKKEMELDE